MDGWSNDHLLEEGGELTRLQKGWVLKKTHVFPDTRGLWPDQLMRHNIQKGSKARPLSLKGCLANFDYAMDWSCCS